MKCDRFFRILKVVGLYVGIVLVTGVLTACDGSKSASGIVGVSGRVADVEAPQISSFSFSPQMINTDNSTATVDFVCSVSDDLSDVKFIIVEFLRPDNNVYSFCPVLNLESGTFQNGVVSFQWTFEKNSMGGLWIINRIRIYDAVYNSRIYDTTELMNMGSPTALIVQSTTDATPPELGAFTFSPSTIDTTAAPATITFHFTVTDDLSGVSNIRLEFERPDGSGLIVGSPNTLINGTINNGTFEMSWSFKQYSMPGLWTVKRVILRDNSFNERSYTTSELTAMGAGTQFTVVSIEDVQAPVMTDLTFSPSVISTTNAAASVTFNCTMSDDLSGLNTINLYLTRPDGVNMSLGLPLTLVSGTWNDGIVSFTWTLSQHSLVGNWNIQKIVLRDKVFNQSTYTADQLQAMGIGTVIVNQE